MWDVVFRFVVGMAGGAAITALVMRIRGLPSIGSSGRAGSASRRSTRRSDEAGDPAADPEWTSTRRPWMPTSDRPPLRR